MARPKSLPDAALKHLPSAALDHIDTAPGNDGSLPEAVLEHRRGGGDDAADDVSAVDASDARPSASISDLADLIFAFLNEDGAGDITRADYLAARHIEGDHAPRGLVRQFDAIAGDDHVLTKAEIIAALTDADSDGDEQISPPELAHSPIHIVGMALLTEPDAA